MDITKIQPISEWIEYELEAKKPTNLRFRIEYIPQTAIIDYISRDGGLNLRGSEVAFDMVLSHIREWDIKDGDKDLPTDKETKEKYRQELRLAFDTLLKGQDEKKEAEKDTVTSALYAFARDQANFLKN